MLQTFYSVATLEKTLLLLDFAFLTPCMELVLELVLAATDELHKQRLLRSEQAMHIWAVAHSVRSDPGLPQHRHPLHFEVAYHTLSEHHEAYVQIFYRSYVDSPDDTLFGQMHRRNPVLCALILQFATFYFDGSLERTRRLLSAARELEFHEPVGFLLSKLHEQMAKRMQQDTFEAFQIFVLVKQHVESEDFESQNAQTKALFQNLLLEAPQCVQLFLGFGPIQLINRFTATPLCNSGGPAPEKQATPLTIRPLASLRIKLLATALNLELGPVRSDGSLTASLDDGTEWMVRAHDQHHIKIYSQKGMLILNAINFITIFFPKLFNSIQ